MNDKILISLLSMLGVILGTLISSLTNYLFNYRKFKTRRKRKKILKQMLQSPKCDWRKLSSLSHVIGANKKTTKRLLLEIGARASEDGSNLWALIKDKPFLTAKKIQ